MIKERQILLRGYIIALFFLTMLAIMLARAYQLQVLEKGTIAMIARAGYTKDIFLPHERGNIYDREGRQMAVSIDNASIYINPLIIQDIPNAVKALSSILNVKKSDLTSRI